MKFDEQRPFVTIAIPAYNHELYVTECLESAAAQTYPNLDLIVVDDGSTDRTFARIEEFVQKTRDRFRKIQVYTRPNCGLVATMNELLQHSETPWMFICASDDIMYPHRVSAQVDAIESWDEPELSLILGQIDWIDSEGNLLPEPLIKYPETGIYHDAFLQFLATNPTPGSTTAIRREAVLAVGGYDTSLPYEDWAMALELAVRYPTGFIADKLAAYRRHDTNLSASTSYPRHLWVILVTTAKFFATYGSCVPADWQQIIYRKNILRTIRCVRRHRPALVLMLLWDLAMLKIRCPQHEKLQRYANWIRESMLK